VFFNKNKLHSINKLAENEICAILAHFNIKLNRLPGKYVGACPVHCGDSPTAFNYSLNTNKNWRYCSWKCFTHNCHQKIGGSFLNFVGNVLNKSNNETLKWIEGVYGKLDEFKYDNFTKNTRLLTRNVKYLKNTISLKNLKSQFCGPSDYYINKGYSKELLEKYWVGIYLNLKDRVTVPVFDKDFVCCLGYSSRSLYKQCCICDQYHDYDKPCPVLSPKWKHSYKFHRNSLFYNQWEKPGNTIFLVEGPADTWRMIEAGIKNTWGIFGSSITDDQKLLLESSGATNIVTFLDPDEAGVHGAEMIKNYCKNLFNYHNIAYVKEPADCTEKEINKLCGQYC
jgi:5S rRNA maturation endonuclease (ribonuclease M5)